MTVAPLHIGYGYNQLRTSDTLATSQYRIRLKINGLTVPATYPTAHITGSDFLLEIVVRETGGLGTLGAPTVLAVAAVEDGTEVSGRYVVGGVLQTGVLAYVEMDTTIVGDTKLLGAGAGVNPAITKAGTIRLVLIFADSTASAQDINSVDTGGASAEYHFDSDNNAARGGLAAHQSIFTDNSVTNDRTTAAVGRRASVESNPTWPGNKGYGDTVQLTVDLKPTTSGTAFINPKQVKLAWGTTTSGGTIPKGVERLTPTTAGVMTGAAFNIDTDWTSLATTYFAILAVNNELGDATTPSGEIAALYTLAGLLSIEGLTTSQRAWLIFDSGATHASDFTAASFRRVHSTVTQLNAGYRFRAFTTSGLTLEGILVFDGTGYATQRYLFRRRSASVTTLAIPAFETFIENVHGALISSKSFKLDVLRHSDSAAEPTQQTVSTGSGGTAGRLRWNYTIADTHTAFNRFKKSTTDNPISPPITFAGSPVAGPHPAYPKHAKITGNAYAGVKEPTQTTSNVLGVNSEVHFEDIWTGDLAQATIDGNGEPTGVGRRTKNIGTGSMRLKLSTDVNEATGVIATPGEHNPKTVDGNAVIVTADTLTQRTFIYKRTGAAVEDSGTNSGITLNTTKGYDTSPNDGFDLKDASGDARTLDAGIAAGDVAGAVTSVSMTGDPVTAAAVWVIGQAPLGTVGFVTDQGNFGYQIVRVQFVVVDPDLVFILVGDQENANPGENVQFTAKTGRFLPDGSFVEADADSAPTIYIHQVGGIGVELSTLVNADLMTAIGAIPTPDWEYTYVPPANGVYKAVASALVQGSRPPAPGEFNFGVGQVVDEHKEIIVLAGSTKINAHFQIGDTLGVVALLYDDQDQELATITSPVVSLFRITGSVTQYYDGTDWQTLVSTVTQFTMSEIAVGSKTYVKTFASSIALGWTARDVIAVVSGTFSGVAYETSAIVEVTGPASDHDRLAQVIIGAGPSGTTDISDHWHVGQDLLIGLSVFDLQQTTLVAPDTSPAPHYHIFRVNQGTGRGQYLKTDFTWANVSTAAELAATTANGAQVLGPTTTSLAVVSTAGFPASGSILITEIGNVVQELTYTSVDATNFLGITGGAGSVSSGAAVTQNFDADAHAPSDDPADSRIKLLTITAAQASTTNGWDDSDIFILGHVWLGTRQLSGFTQITVVAPENKHSGYSFDPTGGLFR